MINSQAFIYLATILPPILLGIIIWKSDKFPEPGKFLVTAFLLGVAIDLPLHFLTYHISSYSFCGNYFFLNLEIQRSQYINVRKLFKGGNYMRKYSI